MSIKLMGETGLAKLVQLIKANFISNTDIHAVTEVTTETASLVDIESVTELSIDSAPTASSNNLVTSGGVYTALSGKEATSNKVTALSSSSTDTQYPSALCVYNLVGNIESTLNAIRGVS